MKEIVLKRIRLENFKGIRSFEADFGIRTSICGANATGKTTIFDAFTWCLFGKDSKDRTDSGRGSFGVKATDAEGNVIEKLDHEVEMSLSVDGTEVVLKRVLSEKWTQKRGTTEVEMTGNETHCYFNGVELKLSDYKKRIEEDIIDDSRFKAITNPQYVCNLPWEKQKALLAELIGNVTFADVADRNEDFYGEFETIREKNMVGREEEYMKSIQASIRKVREDIKSHTQQVTGMKSMIPEMPDVETLNAEKKLLSEELDAIEYRQKVVSDAERERFEKVKDIEHKISDAKAKAEDFKMRTLEAMQKAYREQNEEYYAALESLESLRSDGMKAQAEQTKRLSELEQKRVEAEGRVKVLETRREGVLAEWHAENDKVFAKGGEEVVCPLLKRACDSASAKIDLHNDRIAAERAYNEAKDAKLAEIEGRGREIAGTLVSEKDGLAAIEADIEAVKAERVKTDKEWQGRISEARMREIDLSKKMGERPTMDTVDWSAYGELSAIDGEVRELRAKMEGIATGQMPANGEDMARKAEIKAAVTSIDERLGVVRVVDEQNARVAEMEREIADMSQNLADMEREADILSKMRRAVDAEIQRRCDLKFRFVKWKLSETQLNGGELATCYAMADGVRYSDQNSAMQVNMGLDIINALCEHYGVSAPIFIDNAEGVNELEDTGSQVIRLVVTEDRPMVIKIS